MLDFDSSVSIDQEVFQYMTDNKMYTMMSSSNDDNIEFAIQKIGRLIIPKNKKEVLDKMLVNDRQKDAIFTLKVQESVTGLKQSAVNSSQVVKSERNTMRSHKVE